MEPVLNIWTDGACPGNGFGATTAGVGVYFGPRDPRNVSMRLPVGPYTNQRAELWALLMALRIARGELGRRVHAVRIHSDSQYGINCITQWLPKWVAAGWRRPRNQPVMNRDILELLWAEHGAIVAAHGADCLKFQHVRGHSGDPNNDAADALAVAGCSASAQQASSTPAREPKVGAL